MDPHVFIPRDRPRSRRNNSDVLLTIRPGQLPPRTLWEPERQSPRNPRRASRPQPQAQTKTQPLQTQPKYQPQACQQPRLQPKLQSQSATIPQHVQIKTQHLPPQAQPPSPSLSGNESTSHFLAAARTARMDAYLTTWDLTFATASALPDTAAVTPPDISKLTLDANPLKDPTSPAPTTPEGVSTDGGVTIRHSQEKGQERPQPTPASQLSDLKAKIPWLAAQRTIHGAGWRPLGEYYWGEEVS